jgi:hypothetical protein
MIPGRYPESLVPSGHLNSSALARAEVHNIAPIIHKIALFIKCPFVTNPGLNRRAAVGFEPWFSPSVFREGLGAHGSTAVLGFSDWILCYRLLKFPHGLPQLCLTNIYFEAQMITDTCFV